MLIESLDELLGTRAKVRLLRALLPLSSPATGGEARILAGLASSGGTAQALAELTQSGLLTRSEAGRAFLYEINRKHVMASKLSQLFRAESELPDVLGRGVLDLLERGEVRDPVASLWLFGSVARGEATPASDIDLMVVLRDPSSESAVRSALREGEENLRQIFGARVSPYILTAEQARARHRRGDPLLLSVSAEGRTLHGPSPAEVLDSW